MGKREREGKSCRCVVEGNREIRIKLDSKIHRCNYEIAGKVNHKKN